MGRLSSGNKLSRLRSINQDWIVLIANIETRLLHLDFWLGKQMKKLENEGSGLNDNQQVRRVHCFGFRRRSGHSVQEAEVLWDEAEEKYTGLYKQRTRKDNKNRTPHMPGLGDNELTGCMEYHSHLPPWTSYEPRN